MYYINILISTDGICFYQHDVKQANEALTCLWPKKKKKKTKLLNFLFKQKKIVSTYTIFYSISLPTLKPMQEKGHYNNVLNHCETRYTAQANGVIPWLKMLLHIGQQWQEDSTQNSSITGSHGLPDGDRNKLSSSFSSGSPTLQLMDYIYTL